MTTPENEPAEESLGKFLKRARLDAGISFGQLSVTTGIARSQLHRIENDQVKKVNPAQLAVLAESLDLSLYRLYEAAGYPIQNQSALPNLGNDLEAKLSWLPPEAVERLDAYVDKLVSEHGITLEPDDEPAEA